MGFFSSNKPHITTIIDIGSSSVGVARVLLDQNTKPVVLSSVRKEMVLQADFSFDRFLKSMLETLDSATNELAHLPTPEHDSHNVLCVFASPWYASQTRILKKKFDKPEVITKKLIENIHDKEIASFKESELKIMGADAVILETECIQTKLNGYDTTHPYDKEAEEFQTALYVSISPHTIVSSVTEKIRKAFHSPEIRFSSFPFVSFITMRDIYPENNFLLIDISGEVTDVSIVRKNILEETFSFALGKNFIARKIVADHGSTFEEAVSQFRMLMNDDLTEAHSSTLDKTLGKAGKEWIVELEKSILPIIEKNQILPHNVFVTADEDVSKWFIAHIQQLGQSSFAFRNDNFNVRHLNAPFLSSFCASEKGVTRDSFIMIESLFARRFH